MSDSPDVPIPYRIIALMQERNRLFAYPLERLATGVRDAHFQCTGCGACCTNAINDHIFLLDRDVEKVKKIDSAAYVPAPNPEFCDQHGTFYVSGYALRMRDDPERSCWFLENGRCRIYEQRFSGCRIYPHMLRRSAGVPGHANWRQFARRGRHGMYDPEIPFGRCIAIAREVKEYENAFLSQQIAFLELIHEYFIVHSLRHDPALLKDSMKRYGTGAPARARVFHAGELEDWQEMKL